jgi:hypothetical protein
MRNSLLDAEGSLRLCCPVNIAEIAKASCAIMLEKIKPWKEAAE